MAITSEKKKSSAPIVFLAALIFSFSIIAAIRFLLLGTGISPVINEKELIAYSSIAVVSMLFSFLLNCLYTKNASQLSQNVSQQLHKIIQEYTSDEEGLEQISNVSGDETEQLPSLLNTIFQKIKECEERNSKLLISNKVSLYTRARFESIFEEFPDGLIVMDESATATFVNCKIEVLLEKKKEEITGHKFNEWCSNEQLLEFFSRFQNNQSRLHRKEELLYSPEHFPDSTLSITAFPIENQENNTLLGTFIICRDVTAEMLAKQARGDFVAHISHELKSPLNVLKMYSEMLLGEDGDDKEVRIEAANVIYDEVDRLSGLISNLLSISKIEMGSIGIKRARTKLKELLEDSFATIARNDKEQSLDFKLELPENLSHLSIDKDLFRVALNNLLTNAIKYNKVDGSVTLSAHETDDHIEIQVKDTGLGIADEDKAQVFDKFFRSEEDDIRQKAGHGLGLSLAKNIIELHHGKLELDSQKGEGSIFTISFKKSAGLISEGL